MNTPTIELMNRAGQTVATLDPVTIEAPGPVRLRAALMLDEDATDDEVMAELRSLHRAAACDSCRHTDADSRGHFACSPYHPAWDVAEDLGLAGVFFESNPSQWLWVADGDDEGSY